MTESNLRQLFEGRLIERRYRLVRLLAEGNFGGVFHGQFEIFDESVRDVAVKISKQTGLDKEKAKDVFAEAILLARIQDQIMNAQARGYIVPVYDMGVLQEHDRRGFIVMGLIAGAGSTPGHFRRPRTLHDEIRNFRSGMGVGVALALFKQICTGMAAVHALRVVHRDLKPDNILLTATGQIRIVDFGLAAGLNAAGYVSGQAGTYRYMAPETARRGISDPRSDVYSLGIILYELLTGRYPFEKLVPPPGLTEEERNQWVLNQKRKVLIDQPTTFNREVDPWLDALVLDCLRFESEQRPKDAGALLRLIERGPHSHRADIATALQAADAATDQFLRVDWRQSLTLQPNWQQAADSLQQAAKRLSINDSQWFDINTKLALCYVHLKKTSKVSEILKQLVSALDRGLFVPSYRELAEFHEGFAAALENTPGMKPWAIEHQRKAQEARRRSNMAEH